MTGSIEQAQREARRAWVNLGPAASLAPLSFFADVYKGVETWVAVANASGVGYKESMTLRVVRPLKSWEPDDVQETLEALYDDLLQAKAGSGGIGVRRGF